MFFLKETQYDTNLAVLCWSLASGLLVLVVQPTCLVKDELGRKPVEMSQYEFDMSVCGENPSK